ncbi:hypothetical protein ACOCG7_24805 [Paraburkholderia sp. DD10]|jgi:hypothetical protein|uniref:hypothetical protein n=1 Tax=Paraburkholderia TaxID=1822464 RepID=UPI003A015999
MEQYADTLRRLCFAGVTEPSGLHALSLRLVATAPDARARHEAHRLSQEAFDKSPRAFCDRLWRLWNSLPAADKPELMPATVGASLKHFAAEVEPDTTGMTKHLPRR